jgi:hypothetical protein
MLRRTIPILMALVLVLPATVRGEVSAMKAARTHSDAGLALFEIGDHAAALREFEAGYRAMPLPQFLFNMGQCHMRLNQLAPAKEMFVRYLREGNPDEHMREKVQRLLQEVERKQLVAPEPASSPPPAPAAAAPTVELRAAPAPSTEHPRWRLKHLAWIAPLAAVVIGTSVGLGVYYGTRPAPANCGSAALGCVDWRQ